VHERIRVAHVGARVGEVVVVWLRHLLGAGDGDDLVPAGESVVDDDSPGVAVSADHGNLHRVLHLVSPFYVSNGSGRERAIKRVSARRRRLRRRAVIHVTSPQQRPTESVPISGRFPIPMPYASQIA
jgi:hypothetical protein